MVQGDGSFRMYRQPGRFEDRGAHQSSTRPWEGEWQRRPAVANGSNVGILNRIRSNVSDRLDRAPSGSQYDRSSSQRSTGSGAIEYNGTYVDFQQGDDVTLCVVIADTQPNMNGKCISAFSSLNLKVLKLEKEIEERGESGVQRFVFELMRGGRWSRSAVSWRNYARIELVGVFLFFSTLLLSLLTGGGRTEPDFS